MYNAARFRWAVIPLTCVCCFSLLVNFLETNSSAGTFSCTPFLSTKLIIIQLLTSDEVDIMIYQSWRFDIHRGRQWHFIPVDGFVVAYCCDSLEVGYVATAAYRWAAGSGCAPWRWRTVAVGAAARGRWCRLPGRYSGECPTRSGSDKSPHQNGPLSWSGENPVDNQWQINESINQCTPVSQSTVCYTNTRIL